MYGITEKHALCLNKGLYIHNLMGASAKGPRGRVTLGRTVPPYTECHENALQSYRHKQLNTQLQEYTEVPGEAIWWQRMQEKLSAAGAAPDPVGGVHDAPQTP